MKRKRLIQRVIAGNVGPFFRSRRRVKGRVTATLLPRLRAGTLSTICFCKTKYIPSGIPVVRGTLSLRLGIGGNVRIGASVLTIAHDLYKRGPNVTYVLKANSGSYFCSNRGVIGGISPLKFVLKSRNDNTMLKGLLMNSVLGGRVAPRLGRGFVGGANLAPPRVVSHMCHRPFPGHFLTDLSPFLTRGVRRPSIRALILNDFGTFLGHGIVRCSCRGCPTRFVNSITCRCRRMLRRTTRRLKMRVKIVIGDPVRNLVAFRGSWVVVCPVFVGVSRRPSLCGSLRGGSVQRVLRSVGARSRGMTLTARGTVPRVRGLMDRVIPHVGRKKHVFCVNTKADKHLKMLSTSRVPPAFNVPPALIVKLVTNKSATLHGPMRGTRSGAAHN